MRDSRNYCMFVVVRVQPMNTENGVLLSLHITYTNFHIASTAYDTPLLLGALCCCRLETRRTTMYIHLYDTLCAVDCVYECSVLAMCTHKSHANHCPGLFAVCSGTLTETRYRESDAHTHAQPLPTLCVYKLLDTTLKRNAV